MSSETDERGVEKHWNGTLSRIQAVRIIEKATDQDDPFWEHAVDDFYDEATDTIPSIMDVLAAIGVTETEYREASGADGNIYWPTLPKDQPSRTVVVDREPTEDMIEAGAMTIQSVRFSMEEADQAIEIYKAMLSAAPQPCPAADSADMVEIQKRLTSIENPLETICCLLDIDMPKLIAENTTLRAELASLQRQLGEARAKAIEEPLGGPVDSRFKPTRKDLDALRRDYEDYADLGVLPVTVHVAPAVLYMTWPNSRYKPDDGSDPYHCISFRIPKPDSATEKLRSLDNTPTQEGGE